MPDLPQEPREPPSLQLPTVTYLSIPPCICAVLVMMVDQIRHLPANEPPSVSVSPFEIVVVCVTTALIGFPAFFVMARHTLFQLMHPREPEEPSAWVDPLVMMQSMFRLPEAISRAYRWFVPVYYGSIAAGFLCPLAFFAWRVARLT